MRGRYNYNVGSTGWVQASSGKIDWFQVDLGTLQDIRCLALQGRSSKKQFITMYQVSYSMDGSKWEFAQTAYGENVSIGPPRQHGVSIALAGSHKKIVKCKK
jgi:hypothetical protein